MRSPARSNFIVMLVVALVATFSATRAWADDPRIEARTHYQAGLKSYNTGDYKTAVKEFSAAQQLAPADLNSYNLALCYDKLGDADSAVQYYREYLSKVPDAPKRAEIEASISRLDAASKSAAKKSIDAKAPVTDDKLAPPAPPVTAAPVPKTGPAEEAPPDPAISGGSTGTPSTGVTAQTGDAQLDRVAGINIDQIRDQRLGMSGTAGVNGGPDAGAGPNGPVAAAGPNGAPPPNGPNGAQPAANVQPAAPDAPKDTPVYKKWWFWAVVAVSAYVVYEIATQDSSSSNSSREMPLNTVHNVPSNAGLTLLHF